MIFFCDSGGNIFNVIPSRIYQGSAGANTIRFVGQFPSSSQVLVAYKLPNGVYTQPKYMAHVDELEEVQAPNGGKYSVWESVIGATPKYDDQGVPITDAQGNQEYKLDYAVTETPGEVTVQFYVYGPMQQGGVPGARLATASSSFTVEKGVPVILEVSNQQSYEDLLAEILYAFSSIETRVGNLETWQEQADQDIDNLETDVALNASRISTLSNEVEGLDASVSGLSVSVNGLHDWAFGENGTPSAPSLGSAAHNIEALDASVSSLRNTVGNLNNTVIPAINARIDLQEQALKQSGLQYSQDITQEYQTRETANGEFVLNGSNAILKTVVGNTVATSNQLNASLISNSNIQVADNGRTITLVVSGNGAGPLDFGIGKLKDLCPYLHIGDSVYLYGDGNFSGLCNSLFTTLIPKASTSATVLTEEILDTDLYIQVSTLSASTTISNLQITKVQNAQWYPFFTGLKSASFAGVESFGANMFDYRKLTPQPAEGNSWIESVSGDRIVIQNVIAYLCYATETLSELCPNLKEGDTVYLMGNTDIRSINLYGPNGESTAWAFNNAKTMLPWMINARVGFAFPSSAAATYTIDNLFITTKQNLPFSVYSSINYDFPSTATPLGTTIDFENKKIVDYGITVELDGTGNCLYYGTGGNGVEMQGLIPISVGAVRRLSGVSTDSVVEDVPNPSQFLPGKIWIGVDNNAIYWTGILDILGFTTAGTTPTAEEKTTAIANFKAYLAQRYADGNPVTIRYVASSVQSETMFTTAQSAAGDKYKAYVGGVEQVQDNANAEYGAENTLTQNYVLIKEV